MSLLLRHYSHWDLSGVAVVDVNGNIDVAIVAKSALESKQKGHASHAQFGSCPLPGICHFSVAFQWPERGGALMCFSTLLPTPLRASNL